MADARPLCDESKEGSSIDNPIIIDDDEWSSQQCISKQDDSDGDTEPLTTREFEAYFGDRRFHLPQGNSECPVTESTSVLAPNKLTHDQGFDFPESDLTTCTYVKEERPESAKTAAGDERASQGRNGSCCRTAEDPTSCSKFYFLRSKTGDKLEISIKPRQPNNDHPPCQQGPGKRKRGHEDQDDSGYLRSKRLVNREQP
ncbi:hypothetical protein N7499_003682 [Penicillium canescens]|uniref:uncharacterized protein n=1 Tax=Penicillium canescens TaxID=5083 RepID=UPI0026DEC2C9|nr:uncharacterized protein N7446_012627 [Penicillium canescens]KAJ6018370.1 hypothetical protein N7522_001834 [Penicillium canescens]KAJ6045763.1 hypothetical protein N7446_012627 [Penicillium canescens]KAJ6066350.1 hypothetical protein N7444_000103 [Penicillium canescens]KAJ6090968.1 hypothetical protein N7499_003682 [Penicillium canescens]KAJ6175191.1 hypothetical protein N7485_004996 [Penicillium canescens]